MVPHNGQFTHSRHLRAKPLPCSSSSIPLKRHRYVSQSLVLRSKCLICWRHSFKVPVSNMGTCIDLTQSSMHWNDGNAPGYESAGPPGAQTFEIMIYDNVTLVDAFWEGPKPTFWWATSALVLLCQLLKEPGSPTADGGWVVMIGMIMVSLHGFL